MKILHTFFLPNDDHFEEHLCSLFCANGYAADTAEIQRLLLEQIKTKNNGFIKVTLERSEKNDSPLPA